MFRLLKLSNCYSMQPYIRGIKAAGIEPNRVIFNPNIPQIYHRCFLNQTPADPYTKPSFVSSNGALCAYSGNHTQRKSKNSRLVKDKLTQSLVNWNQNNLPIDQSTYDLIQKIAVDYINHRPKLFLVDGYLGWDKNYRLKVRSYVTRPYHALFMRNILVRPTQKEIQKDFVSGIDITLYNGGQFNVSKSLVDNQDNMISAINLSQQKITILGSQFAGQMKKSLLKLSSFILPRKGLLPMRASAFTTQDDNVCMLIGLPGSGKGSLALHAKKKKLIANDEIVWSNDGVYNLQGGVYARILNLRNQLEQQVSKAIRFGAVVQNANHKRTNRDLNLHDVSVTSNARLCYPLDHLSKFKQPATGGHPNNIILLTCDLQGILPPVAKLTKQQALFYYLNGYTAMLNNKQLQPKSIFSTCQSGDSTPLNPQIYAELFKQRLDKSNTNIWLLNTGWTHGRYGIGKRISSENSTRIIDAINNKELDNVKTYNFKYFNIAVPENINGVNQELLYPETRWADKKEYDQQARKLAQKFVQNYTNNFKGKVQVSLESAIPQV